jgi:hypothetical protein
VSQSRSTRRVSFQEHKMQAYGLVIPSPTPLCGPRPFQALLHLATTSCAMSSSLSTKPTTLNVSHPFSPISLLQLILQSLPRMLPVDRLRLRHCRASLLCARLFPRRLLRIRPGYCFQHRLGQRHDINHVSDSWSCRLGWNR